ncbi:Gfo/Idh/MocA family oxidoreductase [Sediminibacterium sp. KACHI17]|uniref:Gfo/Idh/MocA family oxidoreductase n=1 Tax=Sediminibacterium sp. KACHI17 TaxID=1751071 RepID=A0AAT9GI79_9BACT
MKKIRVALLSFGMSGKVFHAPFLDQHAGFELYAVWERSKSESAAIYPTIKIVRSLEALLEDDSIELIVVNTPTHTHYEYAKKALEAGKSVIVEKAFTTTTTEAQSLAALAKEKKLLLSVYQNRRWDSDFQTVQKIIQDGVLGELKEVSFRFDRFKNTIGNKTHKEQPGPGAGLLNDLGPHLIDQALVLFGKPEKIFADIRILRPDSLVDDYFDLLLYYPSLRVRLISSLLVKKPIPSFILHGSKGSFIKNRGDVQEADLIAGKQPGSADWGIEPETADGSIYTMIDGKDHEEKVRTLTGNYGIYYDRIYQSIIHHTTAPVTANEGIHVMQLLEAAMHSHETQTVITL